MFCYKCGCKLDDDAVFCQQCGSRVVTDETESQENSTRTSESEHDRPTTESSQESSIVSMLPEKSVQLITQKENISTQSQDNSYTGSNSHIADDSDISKKDDSFSSIADDLDTFKGNDSSHNTTDNSKYTEAMKTLIGKNWEYYLREFERIERGEKSFNWFACLLSPAFIIYRKQFSFYIKVFLPLYILSLIEEFVSGWMLSSDYTVDIVLGVVGILVSIFAGRRFNSYYKDRLEKAIANDSHTELNPLLIKKFKPSTPLMILFCIASYLLPLGMYFVGSAAEDFLSYLQSETSQVYDYDEYSEPSVAAKEDMTLGDENVLLTQSYINEEEGFSFMYPEDWTIQNDPELLAFVSSKSSLASYASLLVGKEIDDDSYFSASKSDWEEYFNSFDDYDNAEITDISDAIIDDHSARKITVAAKSKDGIRVAIEGYFYKLDSDVFTVACVWNENFSDKYKPIFDAIIDSYTINIGNDVHKKSAEVLYNGIPVSSFFTQTVDEVIAVLGAPSDHNEYKMFYDNIDFWLSGNKITSGESFSPEEFTYNGSSLDKTRDELIELLGYPSEEDPNGGSGYELVFDKENYRIAIATGDTESKAWRLWIYPPQSASIGNTSVHFPITTSAEAEAIFDKWLDSNPLPGSVSLQFISDGYRDGLGEENFVYSLLIDGDALLNIAIRKSDGRIGYLASDREILDLDQWYYDRYEIAEESYYWDTELITSDTLSWLDRESVMLLRNEIYARHGYVFHNNEIQAYFESKPWYQANPNFNENLLNQVERKNIDTIVLYEQAQGWRS